jgi:GNAT superfamily N-acetyltransferase
VNGYRIEPLGKHDRAGFFCGVEALDRYFRTQAGQDGRKRVAACFVLVDDAAGPDGRVAGYYTLSAASIALAELPPALAKRLPRYPVVPATLLGRLAVDRGYRGRGLGEALLFDAFIRSLRSEIASFAFVADAKDEAAQAFYEC